MLLVIDCCLRGNDSYTRKYYQAYLQTIPQQEIVTLELAKLAIAPLDSATLQKRELLCEKQELDHELFHLAYQFRDAEEIVIAAPFWDLSLPSLLKVYLEQITVKGLTFAYEEDGSCKGYCRAQKLRYFTTCGGYCGERHLGFEYVKALAAMLGIPECIPYIVEGLDIDPTQRDTILDQAIRSLQTDSRKDGRMI